MSQNQQRLMRRREVLAALGIGRSTLDDWVRAGKFPGQIKLGHSRLAWWRSEEVAAWIADPAGWKPDSVAKKEAA